MNNKTKEIEDFVIEAEKILSTELIKMSDVKRLERRAEIILKDNVKTETYFKRLV